MEHLIPLLREVRFHVDERKQALLAAEIRNALDVARDGCGGDLLEPVAAVERRVADVEDDVGDGVVVELAERVRELEAPAADGAGSFNRVVHLRRCLEIEDAGVVYA